eukprot:TRINITY_DN64981_c0_g1_i1.p1 TRINITY_DN64981_c0_g1~~TRINITY_DN64981_c0_g1_i1.p1  ORF type:complete len:792 (-),score=78.24 TRINITY_DN64981_c0_g1_i1:171-2546(-)
MRLEFTLYCALIAAARAEHPWQDPSLPINDRVENLISLLSIEEKASLLDANAAAVPRLGLPGYRWHRECERGDVSGKLGTAYPCGAALGASFDVELVEEIAFQTAVEVRGNANSESSFGASCFGPVSNLVRDSRWGRTAEMLTGEDATLGRIMSAAFTRGMQRPAYPSSRYRMVNTIAKHLNAYTGPEGYGHAFGSHARRFEVEARLSEREWREFFLPAYKGSAEAGVSGFMCSYNSITFTDNLARSTNVPACASEYLLTEVIRKEWNWSGYIVSDAGAVALVGNTTIPRGPCPNCTFGHGYATSASDAAIKSIEAGMDIELTCCGVPSVFSTLPESVSKGLVSEEKLDRALRNTLPIRFQLGQLDPTSQLNPYKTLGAQNVSTRSMANLARRAAERSLLMLKNEQRLLPLRPDDFVGKNICVIGPLANATSEVVGVYGPKPRSVVSIYEGVVQAFPRARVVVSDGCEKTFCPVLQEATLTLARTCDLNILALGLSQMSTGDVLTGDTALGDGAATACGCPDGDAVEGECCDRKDVSFPGQQLQLLQAVSSNGKPTVLVTQNAGMLDIAWPLQSSAVGAILTTTYLGQATGTAIGRTLIGLNNPAARITITYFKDIAETGSITDYNMYQRTYRYSNAAILLPFGFGLSFASFQYESVGIPATIDVCGSMDIAFQISNLAAQFDGDEVVQMYVSIRNASVPVPKRQLVAFQRTHIKAGRTWKGKFTIHPEDHAVMRAGDFKSIVEPGRRDVWIGGSSDPNFSPGVSMSFEVVGKRKLLSDCVGSAEMSSLIV